MDYPSTERPGISGPVSSVLGIFISINTVWIPQRRHNRRILHHQRLRRQLFKRETVSRYLRRASQGMFELCVNASRENDINVMTNFWITVAINDIQR